MKGFKVSDFIRPISLNDLYPTHLDIFGLGGLQSVNTLLERDSISKQRRKEGMIVFVRENGEFFYLFKGIENINWVNLKEIIGTDSGANSQLIKNYIFLGNEVGKVYQSPLLMYLKNDFLKLKKDVDDLNYLDYGAINVGNKYNLPKPTRLGAAVFPLPDVSAFGLSFINNIPIPNPTFNPLSPMDWLMSGPWLAQVFVGSVDTDLSNPKTIVSSSLAMNQIRTAKNFKLFDNANFIVASKNVSFAWDNPAYLLAKIDPKLKSVLSLYDLDNSYTFTKAQSLGELDTGLLKNTSTVDALGNKTGTLSKAISGEDYVNTADIPIGSLVIIDPLYPTIPNHKLIAPITDFKIRKNKDKEFGKEADKINVLDGIASTFSKLALTSIAAGSLIKIGNSFSELVPAIKGTDYIVPDDINTKFDDLVKIIKILFGIKSTVDFFTIANDQVSNLNKVVKTIGGINNATDMINVTSSDASKIANAVKNAVGVATSSEIADAASKAADVFTNKAALVEMEAQIAALAGVAEVNTLWNLFNSIGILATAIGGYHYGQYIRGQTLNVKNTWLSVDKNDEAANATGSIRPLSFTPYSYEDRGHGTLWFDSNGRKSKTALLNDTPPPEWYSEGGLRIFSWDSSQTDTFDSDLAPVHMGLFGYRKYLTQPDEYKGFVFRIELDHDKKSILPTGTDINNDNYRFPVKFGLYDVYRKISSLNQTRYGWNKKIPIFEYDYNSFSFYKSLEIKDKLLLPKVDINSILKIDGTGEIVKAEKDVDYISSAKSTEDFNKLEQKINLETDKRVEADTRLNSSLTSILAGYGIPVWNNETRPTEKKFVFGFNTDL